MSIATFDTEVAQEPAAFYESVAQAARAGTGYQPLALLAMKAARAALTQGGAADPEGEAELEAEFEWESSPRYFHQSYSSGEGAPSATLMEHLGHAAAEAESDGEAFAFLAPLVPLALKALSAKALPLAAKLLPKAASLVARVAPKLIKGVRAAARTLRANPAGKPLVRALPRVVQRTAADLVRQAASGRAITPQQASRTLANQTAKVLGNPRAVVQSVRRSASVDRNFHRAVRSCKTPAAPCCTCSCR